MVKKNVAKINWQASSKPSESLSPGIIFVSYKQFTYFAKGEVGNQSPPSPPLDLSLETIQLLVEQDWCLNNITKKWWSKTKI